MDFFYSISSFYVFEWKKDFILELVFFLQYTKHITRIRKLKSIDVESKAHVEQIFIIIY